MELDEKLKKEIDAIKYHSGLVGLVVVRKTANILEVLQDLCDGSGETQWTIKDQINLAIQELND